jgi:hypothetical protein
MIIPTRTARQSNPGIFGRSFLLPRFSSRREAPFLRARSPGFSPYVHRVLLCGALNKKAPAMAPFWWIAPPSGLALAFRPAPNVDLVSGPRIGTDTIQLGSLPLAETARHSHLKIMIERGIFATR